MDNIEVDSVDMEIGDNGKQLNDLLRKKAEEKVQLNNIPGINVLKRSRFYYSNNGELREHICSYKGYAILLKQENMKEVINDDENRMFPVLVSLLDLQNMKRVNGNVVRKLQPNTLHDFDKLALMYGTVAEIDKLA